MTVDAVRELVKAAPRYVLPLRDELPQSEPGQPHPLTRFVQLDGQPAPPKMVIPGFVQAGVVIISGQQGVGKTTVLVPLAMVAAGLHAPRDPLAPRHWRHVVYISEDVPQVERIVAGLVEHAGISLDMATVRERFHVVPALRMQPEEVAAVGPIYRESFTRTVEGVDLPPLVVIDTRSATIETDDENDNAEAGRIVALFKQRFTGLPLWMVGHLAKALGSRKDVQALSMRGAGAIEADANQTMFLVAEEDGRRFLVLGKRRFEPVWAELEVQTGTADTMASDEFGEPVPLTLRWGLPVPPTHSRAEARVDAEEVVRVERDRELRGAVLDAVDLAHRQGLPLSPRLLTEIVQGFGTEAKRHVIGALIAEGWLVEARVPAGWRLVNNSRKTWLVRLDASELSAYRSAGELPADKMTPPPSIALPPTTADEGAANDAR